jgi:osmotically-inducible protein OsmY
MKIRHASALAVAAGAVLLQCVSAQAGPDDSRIEQSAKNSYAFKTYLGDDHIHVKASDGVVTLTGSVADESQRDLAANTVSSLPGVVSVNNELRVSGAAPEHSDKWLAMKVKSALLFHRNVSAKDTHVVAQNGVVTLTGTARSEAQKELTAEYAKDVDGVMTVNNMIAVNGGATVVESAGAQNNVANPIETSRGSETVGQKIDDASITAQVKGALLTHRSTSAMDTKVKTIDGNVTISGVARDQAEKALVTKLASDVNGVQSVNNDMTVASPNTQ